jgi:Predicted pPIWI-associating nuclease
MLDQEIAALIRESMDDFSRSCLEGARRALADRDNPLRLNFFSTAMRILFEHMMDTLAPNEIVVRSSWFKPEKADGKPTRGQRIEFAIQGGLSGEFVTEELHVDPYPLRKRLIEAFDECSKQIHAREHSVVADQGQQDVMAAETISAAASLLEALRFCREAIIEPIIESLDEAAVQTLMSEALAQVDELATHWSLQEVYVAETKVLSIGAETITYRSTGSIEVVLQWGSNSDLRNDMGAELEQSFPFHCEIGVPVTEPRNLDLAEIVSYGVDTSKWRDAMRPDDWPEDDDE